MGDDDGLEGDYSDDELFDDAPAGAHRIDNTPDVELLAPLEIDDSDVAAAAAALAAGGPPIVLPSRNGDRVLPVVRRRGVLDHYRSHVMTGADIGQLSAPQPLIDGWLDRDSLAVLYGRPAAGKSFAALDIAACIATGSWWHRRKSEKGRVLYVAAEGAYALGSRVSAWLTAANAYRPSILDELRWLVAAPNLFVADDAAALAIIAFELEPALIIVDTLARCAGGADENSARDLGYIIANLDRIRDLTGAAVLVVHHTNKAGETMRGHSALEAAVDTVIECRLDDQLVVLTSTKQKNHEAPAPLYLSLSKIGDSCALTERARGDDTTLENMPRSHREVLSYVLESDLGDGLTRTFIRDNSGAARSSAYRIIKNLTGLGLLEALGEGARAHYRVTERGKEFLEEDTDE